MAFTGPAVIDQFDCTTVVYPGQEVGVDEFKNLIVTETGRT
jgi:N-methylhydantoinase A